MSKEQNQEKNNQNAMGEEPRNGTATDDYDSDHFSEIDSTEQVGNVDTLVDNEYFENKCDKTITFAPGEGQHPLFIS